MRGDRNCVVCQSSYNYCGDCGSNPKAGETWRYMYCSENCKKIFQTLSAYSFKHISDSTANEQLSQLDLSKKMQFREDLRSQISEIQGKDKIDNETRQLKNDKKKDKKIVNDIADDEKLSY